MSRGSSSAIAVPPAILTAIHNATGAWVNSLPATAERVLTVLQQAREKPAAKGRERAIVPARGRVPAA